MAGAVYLYSSSAIGMISDGDIVEMIALGGGTLARGAL